MSGLALTFNQLLLLEGVDPASVVLVRHRDAARQTRALSLYSVWKDGRGVLEAYQAHRSHFTGTQATVALDDEEDRVGLAFGPLSRGTMLATRAMTLIAGLRSSPPNP